MRSSNISIIVESEKGIFINFIIFPQLEVILEVIFYRQIYYLKIEMCLPVKSVAYKILQFLLLQLRK